MRKLARTFSIILNMTGVFILLDAVPPAAQPIKDGVDASATVKYYDISGGTWRDVLADLAAKRPSIAGTDQRYEALTSYVVTMVFPTPGGVCSDSFAQHGEAKGITVRVVETVTFPHLSTLERLSQIDRACWSAYDRDIRDHEEGHLKITAFYARSLLLAIRASHFTSCSEYGQLALAHGIDLRKTQDDYDALTEHGKFQSRAHDDVELPRAFGKMSWCTS